MDKKEKNLLNSDDLDWLVVAFNLVFDSCHEDDFDSLAAVKDKVFALTERAKANSK